MSAKTSFSFLLFMPFVLFGQSDRWQQRAYYQMEIEMDVKKNQFQGKQRLVYQNNSPDTLYKVFYHLYFNAFQPGSMMDVRSRSLPDPDKRVSDRIFHLKNDEIGYQKIKSLNMNGKPLNYETNETILEVTLSEPILPHGSAVFDMEFEAQVPLQIRRSGRDNDEGVQYSMAQWYPKMCEYDYQGWHANPYVGREFYGIWGDFDVKITIDEDYVIGGTGYLQNPQQIGHGYEQPGSKVERPRGKNLTWHFFAPNVHDFVWAADKEYTHDSFKRKDGMVMHFFYQKNDKTKDYWAKLPPAMDRIFDFLNEKLGPYPYQQYSFIQAGDGGMEYPMATLITGERSLGSLIGVAAHELIHSWYQGMLASNEALYAWMDEGFTNWAEAEALEDLKKLGLFPAKPLEFPHAETINGYRNFMNSGMAEPLSTHADHFQTSYAYWLTAYTSGETFLEQLSYIIGKKNLDKGLLRYYNEWKYKHPNANDFIRVMEKTSSLELDWFREYFVNSTHTIDYAVEKVEELSSRTEITIKKTGKMPMPLDVLVTYANGDREMFNIPLDLMRGNKPNEIPEVKFTVLADWPWTHPDYRISINRAQSEISKIEIDPSKRMADMDVENNVWNK